MTGGGHGRTAFAGRIGAGVSPALILVDPMIAYVEPSSPLYLGRSCAPELTHCADLVAAVRGAARMAIWTVVRYPHGHLDAPWFHRKVPALRHLEGADPRLGRIIESLRPCDDEVTLVKAMPSAFFETGLASMLRDAGVDTVVVAGFSTSGCVRATAADALQFGFRPFVVADACADRDEDIQAANLRDIDGKIADVVSTVEAVALLAG